MVEVKSSIVNSKSLQYVKQSLVEVSEIDHEENFRVKTLEYINFSSLEQDDRYFYDMLEFVRFLDPSSDAIAFTTPEALIYLNAPNDKIDKNVRNWEFIYDHECLHQLWDTFGVEKKIQQAGAEFDHYLLNIASDCVINDYLANIRKKAIPSAGLITPELIYKETGVQYDRKKDTQFSLYMKLLENREKAQKSNALKKAAEFEGKLTPKSVQKQQVPPGPPPPPAGGFSDEYIQGRTDGIQDVLDKKVDPHKFTPKKPEDDDYNKGYNDVIEEIKEGLDKGITLPDGPSGGGGGDNGLPQVPWDIPQDQKQSGPSSGEGGGESDQQNDSTPNNAKGAQDAADKAKEAAKDAQQNADKAQQNADKAEQKANGSGKEEDKKALEKARKIADQAKKAAEDAKEAAEKAQKAADKAKDAAKKAGKSDSKDKGEESDTGEGDADKEGKSSGNDKNGKDKKGVSKEESDAAKEAKDQLQKAKEAQEAAKACANGQDPTDNPSQQNNQQSNKSKGWGTGHIPPTLSDAEVEKIRQRAQDTINKYKAKISGEFGKFLSKCRSSVEMKKEGLVARIQKGTMWNKEMNSILNGYVKQKVLMKKRQFEPSFKRVKRGTGFVHYGDPLRKGKIRKDDKLLINGAFYVDRSGSMGGCIDHVVKAVYTISDSIKKLFGGERVVEDTIFNLFAFDDYMKEIQWGKSFNVGGGTMSFDSILKFIKENSEEYMFNIIITDAEFSIDEKKVDDFIKDIKGILLFITNEDNETMKEISKKHSTKLFYILAESDFRIA